MGDELIDMHNRITTEELDRLVRHQLKQIFDHPEQSEMLPPLMIWGAPGIGKSSIIRNIAKELGIGFIDVRLAQREPVDIRGLPGQKKFTCLALGRHKMSYQISYSKGNDQKNGNERWRTK